MKKKIGKTRCLLFIIVFDIVRVDAIVGLFYGRGWFWLDRYFVFCVKTGPGITYMENGFSHDCR